MRKLLTLLLLITVHTTFAQLKNGDAVPDLQFNTLLNAPIKSINLSQLKGKVVLVDFWATWCGSCLEAMPHLKALQARYPKNLQIIAVTDESVKRTKLYIQSRPANFWFATDSSKTIAGIFPHQIIPHSVLISPEGKLISASYPENITEKVIDSLLSHTPVHLAEKKDNLLDYKDLIKQSFAAADTVQYRFMMQGEIKGGPGLSTPWLDNKAFSGRRLTCINLPLASLYMLANGDFPYGRTIDETKADKNEQKYCLDLIVKTHAELLPALRQELSKRFDLQARVTPVAKEVQVLRITDPAKFKNLTRNSSGKRTYYSRHGEIDQAAITMADFAQFLEDYGTGKLTIDETGTPEKFDIKFAFQPENPQSLLDILAGMGLGLSKEQRQIDMLVIYKQPAL